MSLTPSIVLPPRSREGEITRTPRPVRHCPVVTVDEVDLAVELITGKYEALAPHADDLRAFVLESRQSAYAIVQMGWAMAEVEREIGDRPWFFETWRPAMTSAHKEGEALSESTPEGRPQRMGPSERLLLVQAVGPMFVEEKMCSARLGDTIMRAVVGGFVKKGTERTIWTHYATRTSLKIIELLVGEEAIKTFRAQLKEAYAKDEEARRAEAAEEAAAEQVEEPAAEEVATGEAS